MKEIKIKAHLSIGLVAAQRTTLTIRVDDDATDEEIREVADEATEEWAENYIEYGWSFKDQK